MIIGREIDENTNVQPSTKQTTIQMIGSGYEGDNTYQQE